VSVLIKGMEMPTSCGKCKLFDASHAIGLFSPLGWCRVNGKEIFRLSEKADFCPLVPVQEPHGRLGDLDALPWYLANTSVKYATYEDWEMLCDAIAAAPTVIPASEEAE